MYPYSYEQLNYSIWCEIKVKAYHLRKKLFEEIFTILLRRMFLWLVLLLKSPPVNQKQFITTQICIKVYSWHMHYLHCVIFLFWVKHCANLLRGAIQIQYCHLYNHKLRNYWVDKTAVCSSMSFVCFCASMCAIKGSIMKRSLHTLQATNTLEMWVFAMYWHLRHLRCLWTSPPHALDTFKHAIKHRGLLNDS